MENSFTSLTRCPVCGTMLAEAPDTSMSYPQKGFACGSEFRLYDGRSVVVSRVCPLPSYVAARGIEGELQIAAGAA